VSFGAQALPIEDAWKGFVSHQNLRNFLTTVRYSLQRGLGLLPYSARYVADKRGGDRPTKGKGRQQGGAAVGQPQLEFAERRQLFEKLPSLSSRLSQTLSLKRVHLAAASPTAMSLDCYAFLAEPARSQECQPVDHPVPPILPNP